MDARLSSAALIVAAVLTMGAGYRTQNFVIDAPTPAFAKQVGDAAEAYRRELAMEWLGRELPPWQSPIPVTVYAGPQLGAGGATSFMFDRGVPFGWRMNLQGSQERILDSVLPHEVTHTIFATHFGQPLPRWADEGACTTVEHSSEKIKQQRLLIEFLTTGRGIAFNQMFAMRDYPEDILPLYSQGYSLARFLIQQHGRRRFIQYVGDGMEWNNWTAATKKHYGYENLSELQITWLDWVRQGSPRQAPGQAETLLAQNPPPASSAATTPPASPSTPPIRQVSVNSGDFMAGAPNDGWYARRRDGKRPSQLAPPAAMPKPSAGIQPLATPPLEPVRRDSVARPPQPQQLQPIVLESATAPTGVSYPGVGTYRR